MRNEVKLGLAVGGVLLAVLIVYVLVVPGSAEHGGAEVTLDAQPGDVIAPEPADAAAPETATGADTATAEADAPAAPVAQQDAQPPQQPPAVTQTPTGAEQPAAEGTDPFAQPVAGANGSTGQDFDWQKLLYPEGGPPELMNPTAVPTGDAGAPEATTTEVAEATAPVDFQQTAAETPEVVPPVRPNEPTNLMATTEARTLDGPGQALTTSSAGAPADPVVARPAVGSTPSPSAMRTHKIQSGETLSSIAAAAYGSPSYYPHIIRANPGINPDRLRPGTTINLPDASQVKPAGAEVSTGATAASAAAATIDPAKQYKVQPGDSLERISTKLYGTRAQLDKIYDLNRNTIGADPARIKVGQVLNLPEAPTVTTVSR